MRPDELKAWGEEGQQIASRGDWDGYFDHLDTATSSDELRLAKAERARRDAPEEPSRCSS